MPLRHRALPGRLSSETPSRRTARVLCPGISSTLGSEESLRPAYAGKCLCPGLRGGTWSVPGSCQEARRAGSASV